VAQVQQDSRQIRAWILSQVKQLRWYLLAGSPMDELVPLAGGMTCSQKRSRKFIATDSLHDDARVILDILNDQEPGHCYVTAMKLRRHKRSVRIVPNLHCMK